MIPKSVFMCMAVLLVWVDREIEPDSWVHEVTIYSNLKMDVRFRGRLPTGIPRLSNDANHLALLYFIPHIHPVQDVVRIRGLHPCSVVNFDHKTVSWLYTAENYSACCRGMDRRDRHDAANVFSSVDWGVVPQAGRTKIAAPPDAGSLVPGHASGLSCETFPAVNRVNTPKPWRSRRPGRRGQWRRTI